MDIVLDKKNATEGKIKISLSADDYQPIVDKKLKDYSKKAQIKGFRPGKVPASLIKKMYGKSILVDEINHLLSHSLQDYIKEKDLKLIGDPLPDLEKARSIDWDNQSEFEFDYEVGLVDDFEVDLKKVKKVNRYQIKVDAKTVKESIDQMRKQYGQVDHPEEVASGDDIQGELAQIEGGDLLRNVLLQHEDIEKKEFKKFLGAKPGDVIAFNPEKAVKDAYKRSQVLGVSMDELKELKGKFEITIKTINRPTPAELNQDFYDQIFGKDAVSSKEEFEKKVEETIAKNYASESDAYLKHEIKEKVTDAVSIDLPEEFLKKWLLASNEGKVTEEDIEKEFDPYLKDLKWNLIQNRISEKADIKVEHEDVTQKAEEMIRAQLRSSGISAEALGGSLDAFVDNYLKGEEGQNYMKVFHEVRRDKVVDYIQSEIKINEKKVTLDEFKKIVLN